MFLMFYVTLLHEFDLDIIQVVEVNQFNYLE
jgi:hypothetical protein